MAPKFNWSSGRYDYDSEYNETIKAFLAANYYGRKSHLIGQSLIQPLRTTAVYQSWTGELFQNLMIPKGDDFPRVAISQYVGTAWTVAPGGTAQYVRPGRRYTRPNFYAYRTGMTVGWDDSVEAGFDVLQFHIGEAAEELARRVDTAAQTVLDAAITAAHTVNDYGTMSKSAVDAILDGAEDEQFPVTFAICRPSVLRQMRDWGVEISMNWGPLPERYAEQILREGYVADYGGIRWIPKYNAPANTVWFSGDPGTYGRYHWQRGETRHVSDDDIDNGVTKHRWDEQHGHMVANSDIALWKLIIN